MTNEAKPVVIPEGYTPGPWRTDPEFDRQTVLGREGTMVADCAIFGIARKQREMQTNATLIALAPAMADEIVRLREALRTSLECLDAMAERAMATGLEGTSDWDGIAGPARLHHARDIARAALGDA